MLPAGQPDQTRVDRVVNLLRRQAIEVHRATADVGTGDARVTAGSYLVRLNQPYGRLAKTLLEKQTYPDASLRTYDDSAWTMGLASDVDVRADRRPGGADLAGRAAHGRRRHRRRRAAAGSARWWP